MPARRRSVLQACGGRQRRQRSGKRSEQRRRHVEQSGRQRIGDVPVDSSAHECLVGGIVLAQYAEDCGERFWVVCDLAEARPQRRCRRNLARLSGDGPRVLP